MSISAESVGEDVTAEITRRTGKRHRVLLFSLTPFYGGGEIYYLKLAKLLGERYELGAVIADQRLYDQFCSLGISTWNVGSKYLDRSTLRYPWIAGRLARAILDFKPNLVHLNGQGESYLALVPWALRVPAMLTRHTSFDRSISPIKRFLFARNLRTIKATICVSSVLKKQLESMVDERRLSVIPNWLDSLPAAVPAIRPRAENTFRLLYVGRIVRDKGIFELIEALRGQLNASLDVVGEGADAEQARVSARNLPVAFHGFQTDVAPFYRGANLLVFPSPRDGQGLVPIEAMSYGLPCLLSDIAVNQETADQGRAAEFFQCGNVKDLTEKIKALQADPDRLSVLSERGIQHARSHYAKEQVREKYFNVFDQVIGQP